MYKPKNIMEWYGLIWRILLIIGLLWFAMSQFLSWKYKMELLMYPCDLCLTMNPQYELVQKYYFPPINFSSEVPETPSQSIP